MRCRSWMGRRMTRRTMAPMTWTYRTATTATRNERKTCGFAPRGQLRLGTSHLSEDARAGQEFLGSFSPSSFDLLLILSVEYFDIIPQAL